jgi:hypothetical protein
MLGEREEGRRRKRRRRREIEERNRLGVKKWFEMI